MDGDVYLVCALSLPAYPFGRLWSLGLDALLPATFCTEPGRMLILDGFFRDDWIVTHLMPAQITAIAEYDHIGLGAVTAAASLAQCLFLSPL
jgi:hypothetical protein